MGWDDDDVLTASQEAALAAAEQAYQRRSGGAHGAGTATALLTSAATVAPGTAAAASAAVPPARRRRLPNILGNQASGAASAAALGAEERVATTWPSSGDENLAPACFGGRLHYAFTGYEVECWCQWLLQESGVSAVGFDIEWRVTYQTGEASRPVALMQFCYLLSPASSSNGSNHSGHLRQQQRHGQQQQQQGQHHCCVLLHICHSGLTPHLRQLLCSKDILKVGVGAQGDAQKLRRDFGIEMRGVVDLSEYANERLVSPPSAVAAASGTSASGGGNGRGGPEVAVSTGSGGVAAAGAAPTPAPPAGMGSCEVAVSGSAGQSLLPTLPVTAPQRWSLAGLVCLLLRLRLEKSQGLRCSNWEVPPPLSAEQQQYAATDAWCSLAVYEILCKMPAVSPPMQADPGDPADPAGGGPAPAAAAGVLGASAGAAGDCVPACAVLRHLQPAKLAVYQALVQQGLSVEQVAAHRQIQPDSVQGYMAEAITAGLGYIWSSLGVPTAALQQVAQVCSELLGRQLGWEPAENTNPPEQQQPDAAAQQAYQVGAKRPAPCSPASLAAAAARHDVRSKAEPAAVAPWQVAATSNAQHCASTVSTLDNLSHTEPVDVLQQLLAAGHKLRELKEQRFEGISYGQLRLALAHLGRCNPGPWA